MHTTRGNQNEHILNATFQNVSQFQTYRFTAKKKCTVLQMRNRNQTNWSIRNDRLYFCLVVQEKIESKVMFFE